MTAVFLVPYSTGAASTREVKRVLIFYEFGLSSPGIETIDAALRLQSGTKHVVVVAGTAPYDRYALAEARQDLRSYESKLDITYLTDLTMPQLLEKLEHLPEHTVVLLTNFAQDATGAKFISSKQAAPMIATAANAPVFSLSDVDVGYGEVGGDVISFAQEGQIVGDTALRVLNGERVETIPIVKIPAVYLFDWRALKRWGLKEENLPPGSIVLNRERTVWESY